MKVVIKATPHEAVDFITALQRPSDLTVTDERDITTLAQAIYDNGKDLNRNLFD